MAIDEKVYFRVTDPQLQRIPWIKVVHGDGSVTVYKDARNTFLMTN